VVRNGGEAKLREAVSPTDREGARKTHEELLTDERRSRMKGEKRFKEDSNPR